MKIKQSIKNLKHKILVDAKFDGHLSVNVIQVMQDGKNIYYHSGDAPKNFVSEFFPEVFELIKLSGCQLDGTDHLHGTANTLYFAKLTQDQIGKDIYTSEMHSEKLAYLKAQCTDHAIFVLIKKHAGYNIVNLLSEYLDTDSDLFQFKDFKKSYQHWFDQLRKNHEWVRGDFKGKRNAVLRDFFVHLTVYRKTINQYKYTTLPSKRDVWTPEKLADHIGVPLSDLYPVICSKNMKSDLAPILEKAAQIKQIRLVNCLESFNIKYK